jgi:hypothetical protein
LRSANKDLDFCGRALGASAWRLVKNNLKWSAIFVRLRQGRGSKRAIVAVAMKFLCVLYAMLKTSTPYRILPTAAKTPKNSRKRVVRVSTPEEVVPSETEVTGTGRSTSVRRSTSKQTITA